MIDETYLQRLQLHNKSTGQRLFASLVLTPNYRWGKKTHIEIEGLDNLPADRRVIFALNHTDRFNYWPFQYEMLRRGNLPTTTSWVKAKYYNDKRMAWFFDRCNNIPLPSLGYVLLQHAYEVTGKRPDSADYRILRNLVERRVQLIDVKIESGSDLDQILHTPTPQFDPKKQSWATYMRNRTDSIMAAVEKKTLEALGPRNNNLIVFPQGTRALRLQKGHTGLVQFALRHNIPVVPVGSNGSEKIYPGASPWARPGQIVYRIGKALTIDDDLAPFQIQEHYRPFTADTEMHADKLRGAAKLVDDRINELLDPPYQRDENDYQTAGDLDRLV